MNQAATSSVVEPAPRPNAVLVAVGLCLCGWLAALGGAVAATNPPGCTYLHDEVRRGPWSVHVFKVNRSHPGWEIQTTVGGGNHFGLAVVSDQVKFVPPEAGRVIAAINGDFYGRSDYYPGEPQGLQIIRGELISAPHPTRISFWTDASGNPHRATVTAQFNVTWPDGTTTPFGLNQARPYDGAVLYTSMIGASTWNSGGRELVLERKGDGAWLPLQIGKTYTAQVREVRETGDTPLASNIVVLSLGPQCALRAPKVAVGAVLQIATTTTPDLAGAKTALGGGPSLVLEGKAGHWGAFQFRHPRSAIGWNKDYFFLVEVDGRQSSSVGMTYSELADYLIKLGCQEAINLDGGGSATLWAYGSVANSPSQGYERPAANALVVLLRHLPEK